MVKTVQMNANVKMEVYVISELDRATVQPDGWGNSATQVSISLVPRLPNLFKVCPLSACNIEKLGIGPGNEAK